MGKLTIDADAGVAAFINDSARFDLSLTMENANNPFATRLQHLHRDIRAKWGMKPLHRIAVAVYHPSTDLVTTFVESCIGVAPVGRHEALLAQMGSLRHLAQTRATRLIDELTSTAPGRLGELYRNGARSSMTVPIYENGGSLFGFIFFDANKPEYFDSEIAKWLSIHAKIIGLLLIHEHLTIRLVQAVARTARQMARLRDDETGTHLERMSNFARLIAAEGAGRWELSDEFIEQLFWFAPLHDIGKVGVPDGILLKPAKLSEEEMNEMRRHVTYGVDIIDSITRGFELDAIPHLEIARNIIAFHHENMDGSGYPNGARGHEIPIEGRITAVADVFDALTSERPYKRRWSNEEALDHMRKLVGTKFDPDCVEAFSRRMDDVVAIQERFRGDLDI